MKKNNETNLHAIIRTYRKSINSKLCVGAVIASSRKKHTHTHSYTLDVYEAA